MGLPLVALVAGALALGAPGAGADVDIVGDWNITGAEIYVDVVIQVTPTNATNATDGNVTIFPGGSLTLINCTLLLPFNSSFVSDGTLTLADTRVDGPAYFLWLNGTSTLSRAYIMNATRNVNATMGGTWVSSPNTVLINSTWNQSNGGGATLHLAVPLDFQGHTMHGGAGVHFEVDASFANQSIDVSYNQFVNGTLGTVYSVAVDGPAIPWPVEFDIHHNTFNRTFVGVGLLRVDVNSTYLVRDMAVNTTSFGTGIMPGVQGSGIRFKGHLNISNYTVMNAYVGVWMWGAAPYDMVVNIDRMTAINVSYVLSIGGGFADVRNSSFTATRTWIYEGLSQGHIRVYETADTAFFATLAGTNATVEHFVWLPLGGATWQGGVAFQGDNVSLLNATGVLNLTVDPATWTPRYVVAWGVYPGGMRVDNRDLRPAVVEGSATFACSPAQFYLSDGMAPLDIMCTDDRPPALAGLAPPVGSFLNFSSFTLRGSVAEVGSGLAMLEWSLDNATFAPVAGGASDAFEWNVSQGPLPDGAYTFYVRAVDRTGNVAYLAQGPVRVDTEVPSVVVDALPPFANGTTFELTGSTEPFSTLTVRRAYGWNQTVAIPANGTYRVVVPVDEGQNTYSLLVVDRAGNRVTVDATIRVDTVAPTIALTVDGRPERELWTAGATVLVAGVCEAGAAVRVNGAPATVSGASFERLVPLLPGLNPLEVRCTDEAGNAAAAYGYAFYDDAPPLVQLAVEAGAAQPSGGYLTRGSTAALSGTVTDAGSGFARLLVNGLPYEVAGDGSFAVTVPLEEGASTVTATFEDRVGNTASFSYQVTRDSVAPVASFSWSALTAPVLAVGSVTYTRALAVGLSADLSEPATVRIAGEAHALPAGLSVVDVGLVPGENTLTVEFNDTAGNPGQGLVMAITQDSEAPEIQIYGPDPGEQVSQAAVEVSGNVGPGSTVTVGGQAVSVTATGDFRTTVSLEPGTNVIVVGASDAVGNNATRSVAVEYAIPTQPPARPAAGGLELPMLAAGLVAGLAVGALAMRGRGRAPPAGEARPAREDEADGPGPREARGPKGPRGPTPP